MPSVERAACLVHRTIPELAAIPDAPERLRELESHVASCAECGRVALSLAEVVGRVRSAGSGSLDRGTPRAAPDVPVGAEAAHYSLGPEIARGGMGCIYEAWDLRHERRVAIKVLLEPTEKSAQRFAREARITARLQHPAIVPFYEAGVLPTGDPFFAMKLVEGRPLGQVVAEAPALHDRLALLPQVIAVCEALAYAHAQRIVHRDLKPSNVLVGAFGEAVVIDWGLAKELDARVAEDADTLDPDDPRAFIPARSPALTVTGAMLGTPAYMAPEQASGARVDERTDVYALGALLYHVFAGTPPHAEATPLDILEKIRRGAPRPLLSIVPELAPDLAAIVAKAMAREPGDRYASAAELGADLRRIEAGQLVSAHSYSLASLVIRWIARHRAAVTTAAVLVVALVVVGAVSVRRVVHERDRADAAKEAAERARAAAVTQRDAGEKLVEFMIGELKARLEPLGKLELLGGVGARVAEYYQAASAAGDPGDVAALQRRAAALKALSGVEERKQNMPGAIALAEDVVRFRERAMELAPSIADAKFELATDVARLGWLKARVSDIAGARASYARGLALASELVASDPKDPRFQRALGYVRRGRGLLAQDGGDVPGALAEFQPSMESYQRAADLDPANSAGLYDLAGAYFALADAVEDAQPEAGEKSWRGCLDVMTRLLGIAPDNRLWQRRAAWCRAGVGSTEGYRGEREAGLADLRASTVLRDELRKSDPENVEWEREYSSGLSRICFAAGQMGKLAEAREACAGAFAVSQKLAEKAPELASAQEDVMNDLQSAADIELQPGGDAARALEWLLRAAALAEDRARKVPDDVDPKRLAGFHADVARAQLATGHSTAAIAEGHAALEWLAKDTHGGTSLRAGIEATMGDALAKTGDDAGAEARYREAVSLEEAADAGSQSRFDQIALGHALGRLGELLRRDPGRREEAQAALERAVSTLGPLDARRLLGADDQAELRELKVELGKARAR